MKKAYSLDYGIESEIDRLHAVEDILDQLSKDPSPTDLEQMASYILCGKDEQGYNAIQRGEIYLSDRRYSSFRRKADKNQSLDAILDNPMADHQSLTPIAAKPTYTNPRQTIARPRYDRKTGALIDPGDSEIPGMQQLWDDIDHMERYIHVLEGKLPPREGDAIIDNPYRLYQLKHTLIDMRRHQYYLKDAYKPITKFLSVDHPKPQYVDWSSDSFYWMPYDKWRARVQAALLHTISKNIDDYETRENPDTGALEVKWVVQRHTFDWENPLHVRAFIDNYADLYNYLRAKLNTSGRALLFDFERYHKMAGLSEVREFLLQHKIAHTAYERVLLELQQKYGLSYNENHLSTIMSREIPQTIAIAAKRYRIIIETPEDQLKQCYHCGAKLPRDSLFYTKNRSRRDGFSSSCKECERKMRVARGGQGEYDRRTKESTLLEMQAGKTTT